MSWKDNEIDALFKGATPPPPPPFEDGFWEEMEAMLPQKKRRKPFIFWASAIAVLLAVGLGVVFWPEETNGNEKALADKTNDNTGREATKNEQPKSTEPLVQSHKTPTAAGSDVWESGDRKVRNIAYRAALDGSKMRQVPGQTKLPAGDNAVYAQPTSHEAEKTMVGVVGLLPRIVPFNSRVTGFPVKYIPVPQAENEAENSPKSERFYAQIALGAGQSPMKTGSSAFLHSYALGAGIIARPGSFELTYGLQLRMDVAANIDYHEPGVEYNRVTSCRNLYSFETPLSVGRTVGKGALALNVVPGFQMGFSGRFTEYENQVAVRYGRTGGKLMEARTLTLEMGLGYRYTLSRNWQLGANIATDVIRPFYADAYFGVTRRFPVNGQVVLRRTF